MTPTSDPRTSAFSFDYYKFNGEGNLPSMDPTVEQANFIRSRYSIEEPLLEVAVERVTDWARRSGIGTNPKKPYPSSLPELSLMELARAK